MMNKKVSNSREVKPKFKVLKNVSKLSKVGKDVVFLRILHFKFVSNLTRTEVTAL